MRQSRRPVFEVITPLLGKPYSPRGVLWQPFPARFYRLPDLQDWVRILFYRQDDEVDDLKLHSDHHQHDFVDIPGRRDAKSPD